MALRQQVMTGRTALPRDRLKGLTVWLPTTFGALFLAFTLTFHHTLPIWLVVLLVLGASAAGAFLFSRFVFIQLERQELLGRVELLTQWRHASAKLIENGLDLTKGASLSGLLQKIVDLSAQLAQARYGALGVLDETGKIGQFYVTGVEAETAARIGRPPEAMGNVLGALLREGQVLRLKDLTQHPRFSGFPPHHPIGRSFLGVPLRFRDTILGGLYLLEKVGADEFSEEDEVLLQAFAAQAALAVQNAKAYDQLHHQQEVLMALYRASLRLQEPLGLNERLDRLLETARDVLHLDRINILLADPESRWLQAVASLGSEEPLEALRVPIGPEGGSLAQAYLTKRMIVWEGRGPVPEELRLKPPYDHIEAFRSQNFAVVPLVVQGKVIGVLGVDRKRSRQPLDPTMLNLLQLFATQAALLIEQARLYQQAKEHTAELSAMNWELELARRAAEEANRLKSEFLANTSHELRTPLNALIGFLQLLLHGLCDSPEEEREYVQRALAASHHLLTLINDVLDIAKIEAGRLKLHRTRVGLAELLDELARLTQVQATEKGIRLAVEPCEETITVWADADRLKQIFLNLLSNALKFTPHGGEIRVRALPQPEQGYALCEVIDTGIGIPKAKQQRIFEKFIQGDGGTTRRFGGTGLGLAIAKSLVELQGGFIGVESEEGKGSRFFFTVPLWHPESDRLFQDHGSRTPTVGGDPRCPLVLVVEDNPGFGRFLTSLLQKHGFSTLWAITADEAYQLAQTFHPRVVTIDYGLPSGEGAVLRTGWDLLVALQKTPELEDIGLVIITGYDRTLWERLAVHAIPPGVIRLEKPVEAGLLIDTIHKVCGLDGGSLVRVLVAGDDPAISRIVRQAFPPKAFQVTVVPDGRRCLEYLSRQWGRVDLLLLDLRLKEVDGLRILRELKLKDLMPDLPVLVIADSDQEPEVRRLLEDGGIVKVFSKLEVLKEPEILTRYIRELLRMKQETGYGTSSDHGKGRGPCTMTLEG